jgi:hypothetical protein
MIMKHCTKFQVSVISHLRGEVSTRYFTPHPSWIHNNSEKNYWILLSWQYAHLLMIIKHCTKFQVSTISFLVGEVSTGFCDRQTERQKVQKQYVSPRMGGDIISPVGLEKKMKAWKVYDNDDKQRTKKIWVTVFWVGRSHYNKHIIFKDMI